MCLVEMSRYILRRVAFFRKSSSSTFTGCLYVQTNISSKVGTSRVSIKQYRWTKPASSCQSRAAKCVPRKSGSFVGENSVEGRELSSIIINSIWTPPLVI